MERLRKLYSLLPKVTGCRQCGDCCGHVPIMREEIEAIGFDMPIKEVDCRYLVDGKCSAYENRPLMCRIYGACVELPCPYGARSERVLDEQETDAILGSYAAAMHDDGQLT